MTTLEFTIKDGFVPVAEMRRLVDAYEFLQRDHVRAWDRVEAAEADVQRLRKLFDLRPEVRAFARLMEQQLRANDHKPGWKDDNPMALLDRADEELNELHVALIHAFVDMKGNRERVGREAADVANFALMIADVCGCLGETACSHDWKVWPETDGQEQKCMKCGAYRRTPKGEKA